MNRFTSAQGRPRGQRVVTLEWQRNAIVAITHMKRCYLPTGRTSLRSTGEPVIEMSARDYFVERLWLNTDGTALWEQQPLSM